MKISYTILFVLLALITAVIALESTELHLSAPLTVAVGDIVHLNATLTSSEDSLSGQLVDFNVDGATTTVATDGSGVAQMIWQPQEAGNVELHASYPGDTIHSSSFDIHGMKVVSHRELFSSASPLQERTSCETVLWQEEQPVQEMCSSERREVHCSDEPSNLSCAPQILTVHYPCSTSTTVTRSKQVCTTLGYTIAGKIQLSSTEYVCSVSPHEEDIAVICDSKMDGNGDGICAANGGETCVRYIVHPDGSYEQGQRNSGLEFVPTSEKLFLQIPAVEVLP